jgi:hypothetical protein
MELRVLYMKNNTRSFPRKNACRKKFHLGTLVIQVNVGIVHLRGLYTSEYSRSRQVNTWTTVNELQQWNKTKPYACKVRHTLIHKPVVRKLYVKGKLQGFMLLSNFCTPYYKYEVKKVVRKMNRVNLYHTYILIVLHRREICNLCYRLMYHSYTLASKTFLYFLIKFYLLWNCLFSLILFEILFVTVSLSPVFGWKFT